MVPDASFVLVLGNLFFFFCPRPVRPSVHNDKPHVAQKVFFILRTDAGERVWHVPSSDWQTVRIAVAFHQSELGTRVAPRCICLLWTSFFCAGCTLAEISFHRYRCTQRASDERISRLRRLVTPSGMRDSFWNRLIIIKIYDFYRTVLRFIFKQTYASIGEFCRESVPVIVAKRI